MVFFSHVGFCHPSIPVMLELVSLIEFATDTPKPNGRHLDYHRSTKQTFCVSNPTMQWHSG